MTAAIRVSLGFFVIACVAGKLCLAAESDTPESRSLWDRYLVDSVPLPEPVVEKPQETRNTRLLMFDYDSDPKNADAPLLTVWSQSVLIRGAGSGDYLVVMRSDLSGKFSTELARVRQKQRTGFPNVRDMAVVGDSVFLASYDGGLWRVAGSQLDAFGTEHGSPWDNFAMLASVNGQLFCSVTVPKDRNQARALLRFDPEAETFQTVLSTAQLGLKDKELRYGLTVGSLTAHPERQELYFLVRSLQKFTGLWRYSLKDNSCRLVTPCFVSLPLLTRAGDDLVCIASDRSAVLSSSFGSGGQKSRAGVSAFGWYRFRSGRDEHGPLSGIPMRDEKNQRLTPPRAMPFGVHANFVWLNGSDLLGTHRVLCSTDGRHAAIDGPRWELIRPAGDGAIGFSYGPQTLTWIHPKESRSKEIRSRPTVPDMPKPPPENLAGTTGARLWKRWAVVGDDSLRKTGLTDLLTAQLSQQPGIELVEREQLAAALRELEIDQVFGAEQASSRLQLGRLLAADAIVLLRKRGGNVSGQRPPSRAPRSQQRPTLELVICDCRYGARLTTESIRFDPDAIGSLAERIQRSINETRHRFRDGITQLVAVTQFLSRNVSHEFDYLQSGYSALLSAALSNRPGVAVIETEEARAIGVEVARRESGPDEKIAPVFVSGEFRMTAQPPGLPVVTLNVTIQDSNKTREREFANVEFATVRDRLTGDLTAEVLQLADDAASGFDRDAQFEFLAARAAEFSEAGAWEQSTRLREAALLLRPDDVTQRLLQISDLRRWQLSRHMYHRSIRPHIGQPIPGVREPFAEFNDYWRAAQVDRLKRFNQMAGHVRWLIDRRALSQLDGTFLANSTLYDLRMQTSAYEGSTRAVSEALRSFFWSVYPQLPSLPEPHIGRPDPNDSRALTQRLRPELLKGWVQSQQFRLRTLPLAMPWDRLCLMIIHNVIPTGFGDRKPGERVPGPTHPRAMYDEHTLDDFQRLIELCDDSTPRDAFEFFAYTRARHNDSLVQGRFSVEELQGLFERLSSSSRPLVRYYGDAGLLGLQVAAKKTPKEELQASSAELQARLRRMFPGFNFPDTSYRGLDIFHTALSGETPSVEDKAFHLNAPPLTEPVETARVRFQPVDDIVPQWLGHVRCGDDLDVVWDRSQVSIITAPGRLRRIFPERIAYTDRIRSVAWDGRYIWIAHRTSGIHVLTPDGRELANVDATGGLPPYDTSYVSGKWWQSHLGLYPVRPGQCLAMGSFNGRDRRWFATVTLQATDSPSAGTPLKVDVFHTATRHSDQADAGIHESFVAGRPELVVGPDRQRSLVMPRRGLARPLTIDLDSHEVGLGVQRPSIGAGLSPFMLGEQLILPGQEKVFASKRSGNGWTEPRPVSDTVIETHRQYFPVDGDVLAIGTQWHRYQHDGDDVTVERLLERIPMRWQFDHFANMAHYGLVAWHPGGRLHRVEILDEPAPLPDDPNVMFADIPTEDRDRHAAAVRAIEKLGGRVGTRVSSGYLLRDGESHHQLYVTTFAVLPETWAGASDDLSQLSSLHNLQELWCIRASVDNDGLRHIGRLSELGRLVLFETQVTDAGLPHLAGMEQLWRLELEGGYEGREFKDGGLSALRRLPKLADLTITGRGYTDGAIAELEQLPSLRAVVLRYTAIGSQALSEFRKKRPALKVAY